MEDPVLTFLVLVASLFLLGALGEFIFARTRIPDVIWLVLAGVLLGPVFAVVPLQEIRGFVPYFGAVALIVILFEGGSRMVLGEVAAAAPRATLLAILTFAASVAAVVGLGRLAAGLSPGPDHPLGDLLARWTDAHGILVGAIVGGSSSLIIMPSMKAAKVEGRAARLAEMESTLTDALCIVVTLAMIQVVASGEGGVKESLAELGRGFGLALLFGVMAAAVWVPILHLLRGNVHAYTFTLAALFLLYVMVDSFGGNAAMGILAFAILVGNARKIARGLRLPVEALSLELDHVTQAIHSQMAFIMKSFFFTFIGLMLPLEPRLLLPGVVLGVALFLARIPAVKLSLLGAGLRKDQARMVAVAMPRGMAAGVLATLPWQSRIEGTQDLAAVVFAAVTTTIVVFTVGFRLVGRAPEGSGAGGPVPSPAAAVPAAEPAPSPLPAPDGTSPE